jgi:hypothetical protein
MSAFLIALGVVAVIGTLYLIEQRSIRDRTPGTLPVRSSARTNGITEGGRRLRRSGGDSGSEAWQQAALNGTYHDLNMFDDWSAYSYRCASSSSENSPSPSDSGSCGGGE